jgi:hypothetical protein
VINPNARPLHPRNIHARELCERRGQKGFGRAISKAAYKSGRFTGIFYPASATTERIF